MITTHFFGWVVEDRLAEFTRKYRIRISNLYNVNTGDNNVAIGQRLYQLDKGEKSVVLVAVDAYSWFLQHIRRVLVLDWVEQLLHPYSSGQYNITVGYKALKGFTTGDNNIAIYRSRFFNYWIW